jgi:pimeloyl-ACP methyl ester carboxylesterase
VDVGGYQLHYYCLGDGAPTVVLESGLGSTWAEWALVQSQVAKFTRVCSYDRAGYGWSDPGPEPRTAETIVGELHRLLVNSGQPGPYILVGHSFGAFTSCLYGIKYPREITGLVLIDPLREDGSLSNSRFNSRFPGTGVQRFWRLWRGSQELPGWLKNAPLAFQQRYLMWSPPKQLEAEQSEWHYTVENQGPVRTAPGFGDLPVIVVTAAAPCSDQERRRLQIQSQGTLAGRSSRGKQIFAARSQHYIQIEQPELIVEAIREVISASSQTSWGLIRGTLRHQAAPQPAP